MLSGKGLIVRTSTSKNTVRRIVRIAFDDFKESVEFSDACNKIGYNAAVYSDFMGGYHYVLITEEWGIPDSGREALIEKYSKL